MNFLLPTRIPHNYPNRAIRRAVKRGRMQRLPGEWRAYFGLYPQFLAAVKAS